MDVSAVDLAYGKLPICLPIVLMNNLVVCIVEGWVLSIPCIEGREPLPKGLPESSVVSEERLADAFRPEESCRMVRPWLSGPREFGRGESGVVDGGVACQGKDVIVEMGACDVRDIGEAGHLEVESASVETSEVLRGEALFSKGIHEVYICLPVNLWTGDGMKMYFALDGFEEPADTWNPAILKIF